ncbi:hypothetical protein RhiirA4_429742 [Rhizophagus irregularis]|uniref:Uncharacterized protein n=1 Tax=Rhizophagus irregularis TaxID=588596 RepID=A0A2I1HI24_9GLOM|nr:hypothetical protein RhiirA4_429742 [Rhizophagus irregularis]
MYTSYTSRLNEFKNRDLILKSSFVEAFSSEQGNINEMWNDDNDCLEKLAALGKSTENSRVGAWVWDKAESAINKKLRSGKANFKKEDEEFISKLQNFLQEFNLTVEDI